MNPAKSLLKSVLILLLSVLFRICVSLDTITPDKPIKDGETLVSNQKTFALGFFSPGNSNCRYVGIWYYQITEQTVVWVANRDNPLNDSSGILSINSQGNLVLHTQNQTLPIWSTNIASISSTNYSISMAQLLDVGNLVLVQQHNQRVLWQSFDYPTNIFLPFMKVGLDRQTGLSRYLTSWESKDDPKTDGITIMYGITEPDVYSRIMYVLGESGTFGRYTWGDGKWVKFWFDPQESCDIYLNCGPNSYCDPYKGDEFDCTCLPGFKPKSPLDWSIRDGSSGCVRKQRVSTCKSGEGFIKLASVKVPDTSIAHVDMSLSLKQCEQECLRNCSCTAYTSADESEEGIGCLTWHGDLVDIRTFTNEGQDLYIRVDSIVLAQYAKKNGLARKTRMLAILGIPVAVMVLFVGSIVYWLVMKKKRGKRQSTDSYESSAYSLPNLEDFTSRRDLDGTRRDSNFPVFDLKNIIAATDNFSVANLLGKGGFGSVYKGLLQNGMEIAVKRLSKNSRQGIEQFKNEVVLIAKLQHRNLVRILGCCVQGEEKMLIYEYLPNNSLDSYIFDLGPWKEGKAMEIVDPSLGETYPTDEVSRCIHIGLLCVQEHATDRPTMSTVVFMLSNDTPLPSPKQPAFIFKSTCNTKDQTTIEGANSINEITITKIDGR
ncbi:hypothetical protein RGQ29_030867 [Quercus rubra]|uniref:Non-specific serine/threonine protein kinase n=1 Tax=Quercus rubra TaxID=3512 RepID=A0AAN7EIP4_QUERU|nr:hypothetical protein RGQ29_030867 [Quercus rubra]